MGYQTYTYQGQISRLEDLNFRHELRDKLQAIHNQNATLYQDLEAKDKQIGQQIAQVHGTKCALYRAWKRQKIPTPPAVMLEYSKLLKRYERWRRKQDAIAEEAQRLAEQREYGRDWRKRSSEARERLEARGYRWGVDFNYNAITFEKQHPESEAESV